MLSNRFRLSGLIALGAVLVPLMLASLFIGSRLVDPSTTIESFRHYDPTNDDHLVVQSLRLPRTMAAVVCGAALGLAGALMQSITRNTLAEPGTLGVNAGATAGVVLGLSILPIHSVTSYVWCAFIGAGVASAIVHRLGASGRAGVDPVRLVLAGAALSILVQSLSTLVILSGTNEVFESMRSWATGSLDGRGWDVVVVAAVTVGVGAVICLLLARPLNSVALGAELGTALGVPIARTWFLANLAVTVLAGAATAAIGPVGFIGLAAPHIARSLAGTDHRWLFPYSAVLAAGILLIADVLGRVVIFPGEIGAGIMTALIGAPFFVWLVCRGKVLGL